MDIIAKELFLPNDGRGRPVFSGFVSYISQQEPIIMLCYAYYDNSDSYDDFNYIISRDNGRTWSRPVLFLRSQQTSNGRLRYAEPTAFFDSQNNKLLTMIKKGYYPNDSAHDAKDVTWSLEMNIYDPLKDRWEREELSSFGFREGLGISFCFPIITSQRRLLFPAIKPQVNEKGEQVHYPGSWTRASQSLVIIGEYGFGGNLSWRPGEPVTGDLHKTSRGLTEPTICELRDGRIAMICRGSNFAFPDRPGYKWLTFSDDGGESWNKPDPLFFTDGKPLLSGSNGSALFRSIKNEKLYWIGNPSFGQKPKENWPRYPLAIFEVQEEPLAINSETMVIIDNRSENDSSKLQLSNFRYYQDRENGEIVLFLPRLDFKSGKTIGHGYYRYRISV